MMMHSRRLSQSIVIDATSVTPSDKDLEEWVKALSNVFARGVLSSGLRLFVCMSGDNCRLNRFANCSGGGGDKR